MQEQLPRNSAANLLRLFQQQKQETWLQQMSTWQATLLLQLLLISLQIGLPADTPNTIVKDSNGCVALLKNSVHHKRSEHMAM
jgi:hypothetical protein